MILRYDRLYVSAGLFALVPGLCAQSTPAPLPQTVRPVTPTGTTVTGSPAAATIPVKNGDEIVDSFKLSNSDIDSVLDALAFYTGRTILRPGQLNVQPGGFSITLSHLPVSEVIDALKTLLSLNQIAVVPMGDHFLKVVNLSVGKTEAPEFISGSTLDMAPSDRLATKIFQLNFLRAEELFNPQLQPAMFTQGVGGSLLLLPKANAAMVTDTISNLQRLETMIIQLDHPSASGFKPIFYPLHNGAKASDIVAQDSHAAHGARPKPGRHRHQLSGGRPHQPGDRPVQRGRRVVFRPT